MNSTLPIFLCRPGLDDSPRMLLMENEAVVILSSGSYSICWQSLSLPLAVSLPVDSEVSEYRLDFPLMMRLITANGGRFSLLHTPSAMSFSFSSQENMLGFSRLNSSILLRISLLTSREVFLLARPGSKEPVSLYLARSLLMQPWDTRSCLLISHGRIPHSASSIIFCRTHSGKALPLTNVPPSWFTLPGQRQELNH